MSYLIKGCGKNIDGYHRCGVTEQGEERAMICDSCRMKSDNYKNNAISKIADDYGIRFRGSHFIGTVEFDFEEFKEMCNEIASISK